MLTITVNYYDITGNFTKNSPFIFGYNSYNNGPIYVRCAANVR